MNLTIEQMREIVGGAPDLTATHCRQTVFGNFIYYKFENGELFCWVIDNWFLSSNQEYEVTSTQSLRTIIADHDRTNHVTDIRNHISPNTRVSEAHVNEAFKLNRLG